jgi:mannosyltransferase
VERADAIICISDRTREELSHWCPGVRGKPVFVVPLAVSHERWYPETQALREERSSDYVLFVGRRDRYKRFDLAVAAVEHSPGLRLAVVGAKPTRTERSMLQARLGNRAWLLGHVDDRKLRHLYCNAHALVIPSECEGFGLPILEAMACGCPVVANFESGLAETGGSAALWVRTQHPDAYADALGLLSRRDTKTAAIAAGLTRAATFAWGDVIERTISVYRDVA